MYGRRLHVSLVDVDSGALVSAWLLLLAAAAPAVTRTYDLTVPAGGGGGGGTSKKIVFRNPWEVARRFTLLSSDEEVMVPRLGRPNYFLPPDSTVCLAGLGRQCWM